MKKYRVYIEAQELKNIKKDDIEEFKTNESLLEFKYNGVADRNTGDSVEYNSETLHDTKEEAMERFNQIKANEYSTYYWGNNILIMRRVCIEEVDVDDEDEDYIEYSGCMDWEWLEIN